MLKPKFRLLLQEESNTFGRFVFEPLEIGFGHTIGTALRRVLYNYLAGASITNIKIDGVKHQFTSLDGLSQDIVELILNIKKIRVKYTGDKPATMSLSVKGPREIMAGDIEPDSGVEIANPDLVIATLGKDAKLNIDFTVESGLGYSPAEERKSDTLGVIPIDAQFSPVVRVNYTVAATRVGRVTNFDKLILEVTTDGTVTPDQAIKDAAQVLVNYFAQVVSPTDNGVIDETPSVMPQSNNDAMRLTVEELDLPTRIANALRKGGFETVADLVRTPKKEIAKIKNLGSKSVKIIEAALREKDIDLTD